MVVSRTFQTTEKGTAVHLYSVGDSHHLNIQGTDVPAVIVALSHADLLDLVDVVQEYAKSSHKVTMDDVESLSWLKGEMKSLFDKEFDARKDELKVTVREVIEEDRAAEIKRQWDTTFRTDAWYTAITSKDLVARPD